MRTTIIKNRHSRLIPRICLALVLVALTSQGAWGQVFLGTPDGAQLAGAGGAPLSTPPPPPPPGTINGPGGTTLAFMLYNLGADTGLDPFTYVSNGDAVDNDIKGYLYQWGRKTDGHESRGSAATGTLATNDDATLPSGVSGKFITPGSGPFDWRDTRNDDLWGSPKTANDPCPSGYRVPTQVEWQAVSANNTWKWTGNGYEIDANGDGAPELYLPAAGHRNFSNGSFGDVGSIGGYWSSTVSGASAYYLDFSSNSVNPSYSFTRASGFSVRCLAE